MPNFAYCRWHNHHFKSDLKINIDRRFSIEPFWVILSQIKYFQKLKREFQNMPKQTEAKRAGVINPHNYNCNQFGHAWYSFVK